MKQAAARSCLFVLLGVLLVASSSSVLGAGPDRFFWPQVKPEAIKVDGNLSEWGNIGTAVLVDPEHVAGGYVNGEFKGVEDLQGRFRIAWDPQRLYVALSVQDNSVRPLEAKSGVPGRFWQQDGMGLYLDVPGSNVASGRYQTKPTRPWQQEPIIQLTPSPEHWGAETLPEGSQWGCTLADKGYTIEASVPWEALGWQPQAGDRIFFAAILADIDRDAEGKDGPLHQLIWHMGSTSSRPANREYAEARLLNPSGYGAELITSAQAVVPGTPYSWKLLADADQPGWRVTQVALLTPDGAAQVLPQSAAAVDPAKRLLLAGDLDTAALKPGQYVLEATATKGTETVKTRQPLTVLGEDPAYQFKAPELPQRYLIPDPLRSGFSSDSPRPHTPVTREDYLAFVTQEMEAGWPPFEYHLKNKTLSLGGGWYFDYGLRTAAYAVVTQNPVWIERAQQMFEMADAAFRAEDPPFRSLGWINGPLIYYYKQYLTAVNAWKPEYEAMVKDWVTHAFGQFPPPKNLYLGMNNWGLSSGIRGVILKYWLGEAMPDKEKWDKHIAETWGAFLNDVKDIDENTTNYAPWDLWLILFYLDVTNQTDRLRTDERLRYLFERYIYEIAPCGARPQYGSTNGWHDHPALWAYLFERVGQIVGDGRYKYQARMMFDYSQKHVVDWHQYHLVYDGQLTWLTRLLAEVRDDSLPAVPPEPKSVLTTRGKMRVLPPEERERRNMWIETYGDPVPGKLIFRGSNDPGSLWAMVELNLEAGHCSARPTSLNCLMFRETVLAASQGYYEQDPQFHNMVWIEDLEGTQGVAPEMELTVPVLEDGQSVAYAMVQVERYMRWPVTLRRHFLFAKDRFLWVRDELDFHSTFFARIGPSWLSRQMFSSGPNWVNTYFDIMPYTGLGQGGGMHYWKNYNYDLLTWFVPRPGMSLALSDFTGQNFYMNAPLSVRQVWRGLAKEGQTLVFDTLLLPHPVKYQNPAANWIADTVKTVSADPKQTAVLFEIPARQEQILVLSGNQGTFEGENVSTDATQAMVIWRNGQVVNWWVRQATTLKVADKVLLQSPERVNKEG